MKVRGQNIAKVYQKFTYVGLNGPKYPKKDQIKINKKV